MSVVTSAARATSRAAARAAFTLALFALLLAAPRANAQVWLETGDAGQLPATAQTTVGAGALTEIDGDLASPDDVDMYCIHITDLGTFFASLQCVVITGPNLFLFDATGKGVAMNSLCQASSKGVGGALVPGVGTYELAVAYDGMYPFAGPDGIWLMGHTGEQSPNGPGAASPVTSWQGAPTVQPLNPYRIFLQGVQFCEAPTPTVNGSWGNVKSIYR